MQIYYKGSARATLPFFHLYLKLFYKNRNSNKFINAKSVIELIKNNDEIHASEFFD